MKELKITGRLAEVGNLDGGDTPGASIYAGDGRYIEVRNLSEDEARTIAPAFGELVTVSIGAQQFDMLAHLQRQRDFSEKTFGPGLRTKGVCDHIRKELLEIEADPRDLEEWIDVVILALDGAWRCGGTPKQIIDGIAAKQTKNEGRVWPDWRTADRDKAIEHDRSHDRPNADCSGEPVNCPDNEGYGCACDPMNKATNASVAQEPIGFVVQHDANGGNFFTSVSSFDGMRRVYGKAATLVYGVAAPAAQAAQDATPNAKDMVNRFLGWKLPVDFFPDAGISFDRSYGEKWGMPVGTNLLTADQAETMFRYCLGEDAK